MHRSIRGRSSPWDVCPIWNCSARTAARGRGQRRQRHSPTRGTASSSRRRRRPCSSVCPVKASTRQPASLAWAAALWPASLPWLGSSFLALGASGAGARSIGLGRSRGQHRGGECGGSRRRLWGGPDERGRAWRRT
jgi:hypothetical protein